LMVAITYNIGAHIIIENYEAFGILAILVALGGALMFGFGDDYFFSHPERKSRLFFYLIQFFLFVHAMIDGAALIRPEFQDATRFVSQHDHQRELSLSILLHRMIFEVFIWKFFLERYGRWSALLVLGQIAVGTILGFFGGQALFQLIPSYFGLFEAFIGGALLHLVYDYMKDRLKGTPDHLAKVTAAPGE